MIEQGKSDSEQEQVTEFINTVVHKVEQELRDELKAKHYHHDLHAENE